MLYFLFLLYLKKYLFPGHVGCLGLASGRFAKTDLTSDKQWVIHSVCLDLFSALFDVFLACWFSLRTMPTIVCVAAWFLFHLFQFIRFLLPAFRSSFDFSLALSLTHILSHSLIQTRAHIYIYTHAYIHIHAHTYKYTQKRA